MTEPSTWKLRLARLLLAPLLAAGAVGVHFWINVPKGEVQVSKRDQGAQRRAKRARRGNKARAHRPRTEVQLAALHRRYADVDFEDEPIVASWARQAQTLINRAVVEARRTAFDGAPEEPRVVVTQTQCRTVRCRFVLRSPYPHEVTLLSDALRRVEADEGTLWRSFESRRIGPPDAGSPADDHYLEVIVGMTSDDVETRELSVAPPEDAAGDKDAESHDGAGEPSNEAP